jgi:Na+/melibiose symporter-like transporter
MGLLGWLFGYQSARYEGNLLVIPEQSALAAQGIWLMYSIFPAIGAVAALLVLLRFYKLRDKDVQVMADVNQGLISREEGERRLAELKR